MGFWQTCQGRYQNDEPLHPGILVLVEHWNYLRIFVVFCHESDVKAHLNCFDFCSTFRWTNLSSKCWVLLSRSVTLLKALKKVKSLSNRSWIKFEFNQTFAWVPCISFPLFLKNIGLCLNCLNTSYNFCLIFAWH